ncbi:hypothetical protein H1230_13440 [Paenibacillus sp. 19GGS1-52]|nr:hypothetical protein [Paenibacillus sp. 19GGS1-52]ULO09684.1 hypothetical protein H1230_13440 [Paenibacillus sp. 19GGS1-52]
MTNLLVTKIGTGVEGDLYRPDTTEERWQIVETRDTEYVIELIETR